jgi:predicted nucleic acid-binding protein
VRPADAFVVDAPVAAKWQLLDEDHAEVALALLRGFADGEFDLLAPDHIRYEVANAITMATRRTPARLSVERAEAAIVAFLSLRLTTSNDNDLLNAAYAVAREYNCAYYDALYLALAQRTECPLVTADRRFYQRAGRSTSVVWIADCGVR